MPDHLNNGFKWFLFSFILLLTARCRFLNQLSNVVKSNKILYLIKFLTTDIP